MLTSLPRVSLFLAAALTVCAVHGQPPADDGKKPAVPEPKPSFSAFPDLKLPGFDPKADLLSPVLPELPANASVLRKVQREQALMGFLYLARMRSKIQTGTWTPDNFDHFLYMVSAVYPVAAELEDKPADRVPWYEERVRTLKWFELFIEIRVHVGSDPPYQLPQARFARLAAEADLLRRQAEVAKAGGGVGRPLVMKKFEFVFAKPEKGNLPISAPLTAYTAFPDLRAPTSERKTDPDGPVRFVVDETGYAPPPKVPALPAGASTLHKLRHEQVLEGLIYLEDVRTPRVLHCFVDRTGLLFGWAGGTADTYGTAASLELRPADQIPWYESRVRALKIGEQNFLIRVTVGSEPPQHLDEYRFHRLQTEADLIRLKSAVEKLGPATGKPLPRDDYTPKRQEKYPHFEQRAHYTAFPDLKPRTVERIEVKDAEGNKEHVLRDKDIVPLPPLPSIGADAPLRRKVLAEQLQAGLAHLDMQRASILRGTWSPDMFVGYVRMALEVYRVAVELEDSREKRVPWYEARVRTLKDIERFMDIRVQNGSDMGHNFNAVRVARLQAEAELLILKTEQEPVAVAPPVYVLPCCPPTCVQPRQRLLPRLFRR